MSNRGMTNIILDWSDPDAPPPPQVLLVCDCGWRRRVACSCPTVGKAHEPEGCTDYPTSMHLALCHHGAITETML